MDLDEAADQLYGLPPEEFVTARTELVRQARSNGDRELVSALGALRRPTRTAWLVNLLARHDGPGLSALLTLGAELLDAQRRRSGPDLRRLSSERRRQLDALARRAVALGAERGYRAPDGAVSELGATLQAALGDAVVADLVRRGHLTQAATWAGFGPGDLLSALAASAPAGEATPAPRSQATHPPGESAGTQGQAAERAAQRRVAEVLATQLTAAREATAEAERRAAEAETEAARTAAQADRATERVEELRRGLAAAEAEETTVRTAARVARERATEGQEHARRAREALASLTDPG